MTLTKEQTAAMLKAAQPLIAWLTTNVHPHCVAHVDSTSVELFESLAREIVDFPTDIEVKLIATATESPSFNVRITHNGGTIFYNSTRLQGAKRMQAVGEILRISTLPVGEQTFFISQQQFNQICELESRSAKGG